MRLFIVCSIFQICNTILEGASKSLLTEYEMDGLDFAFSRCFFIGIIAFCVTKWKGLSLSQDGQGARNWKPLLINGLSGALGSVLANIVYDILPLTIFFVLACTLPFILAIMSYFYLGEKMSNISIVAAVISFGAIVMLTMAKPDSDGADESKNGDNYVLGVLIAVTCVILFSLISITTRIVQEINTNLVQLSYSWIMILTIGPAILIRWAITGQAPFTMVWTNKSGLLLATAILSNLLAQ